jgi:hypothetical protein
MGNLLAAILFVSAPGMTNHRRTPLVSIEKKRHGSEAYPFVRTSSSGDENRKGRSDGIGTSHPAVILYSGISNYSLGFHPIHTSQQLISFFSYVHPDDRARVVQAVDDARQERKPYSSEFRISSNDGTTRWVAARGEFQYAADGTATRMLGLAVDITEKKRIEDALKKSEEKVFQSFSGKSSGRRNNNRQRGPLH